jgi:hypothetical protein
VRNCFTIAHSPWLTAIQLAASTGDGPLELLALVLIPLELLELPALPWLHSPLTPDHWAVH